MGQKEGLGKKKLKAEREAKKVMTPRQIRARARRRQEAGDMRPMSKREKEALLGKPIEQWDLEELARGRPKDKRGAFSGPAPVWITREVHEKAFEMFKQRIRTDMSSHTMRAIDLLSETMDNDEVDPRGKPMVPYGVKVDVAKFLIEHLLGKPKQPVETDISIKLQHILGNVLVQPQELTAGEYTPASSHRMIEDAEVLEDEEL